VSLTLNDDSQKLLFDKLDSIDKKVTREIHGGNGRGLWEEVDEVRSRVDNLDESIQELTVKFSEHLGMASGKKEAQNIARAVRRLWIAAVGLGLTLVGVIVALIRVTGTMGG